MVRTGSLIQPALFWKLVHEYYPKTGNVEEFPNGECVQELHKACITNKIKKCSDYKKAVDLGKRSGGERILITFYDPCQDILVESPATTSLSYGFYSSMVPEDSIVRDEKENYHIDYIVCYIFIRNQLKMQCVWDLWRKIRTK